MRYAYKKHYNWSADVAYLVGLFASDGCLYGYKDKRWPNSLMYYVNFASASHIFLEWLSSQNAMLYGCSRGSIRVSNRVESLNYAKSDSRKLFSAMYANTESPKLSRKYDKFVAFLQADPYPIRS